LLLVFLGIGLAAGEDGIGLVDFDDAPTAFLIGWAALVVILFVNGFDTRLSAYRVAAGPGLALAIAGTLLTAGLVAIAAVPLLGIGWGPAILLGAVLAPTDAAAVFLMLRAGALRLRERLGATLEIESGCNDPVAILLTIMLAATLSGQPTDGGGVALDVALALSLGGLGGALLGRLIVVVVRRVTLDEALHPLTAVGLALAGFGAIDLLGGSGFLAAYVAGLVAGNSELRGAGSLARVQVTMAWFSQIVLFLTLGLLATPSEFVPLIAPGIAVALALTLLSRPIATVLCLVPFGFSRNDLIFVSWVGLRGAVSILLAIVPVLAGLEYGRTMFNIAFIVVIVSVLVQGWTSAPLARRLRLLVPPTLGPLDRVALALPRAAKVELLSYRIHPGSLAARGQPLPPWARPALIVRGGHPVDLRSGGGLREGDLVYLFASPSQEPLLDRLFAGETPVDVEDRALFGDLVLDGTVTVRELASAYGLSPRDESEDRSLADLFAATFGSAVEVGDRLALDAVELVVREADGGRATRVGLVLDPPAGAADRLPFQIDWRDWMTRLRRIARPR
jgi:cell volume regulation protein A